MRTLLRAAPAAAVLAAGLATEASARDLDGPAPRPLELRVNPSGFSGEPVRETLAEKVARRDRESEGKFGWICRGCVRADAEPAAPEPFDPQASLEAARKARR